MNIRHRIALLVMLSFLAIASIGGYAVFESHNNAVKVQSVTDGVVPTALATADLVSEVKQVQLNTMALVSAPDNGIASQLKDKLVAQKLSLLDGLKHQRASATDAKQQGLLSQAQESLDNYFNAIDETAQLKLAGQSALAEANLYATVAEYQREFGQIIDTLRVEKNRSKDETIASLKASLSRTVQGLSLVTVLAVSLLSLIGWMLYRQVIRPISHMQAEMSEIASSQDFTRRVPVEREDEIGRSILAFNSMIARIQESAAQLRQKSADIQSMLQNIPQGILTITAGNRVHPEYSAYLANILETQEIAGRNVMELLFADSKLGADALSQVDTVVASCIGEALMNFEFNQHLLPGEIEKKMPGGASKILDLQWSPIAGEDDSIARLMVCVRDVTELRKLAAETAEQKRELEIIGEILGVNQEKFHEFITGSLRFIDDNEVLLHQHPEQDAEALSQLFRNMHTIKGNARTYGLRKLANLVHEAEQSYEALRKPRPERAWDQAQLLEQLAQVRRLVERYAHINEVSLGRKGPGRRGNVERYLMVDKAQIQDTLQRLEAVNIANIHELIAARDAIHQTLRLLGTETLHETLGGIIDSLPGLADELGKAKPRVIIDDQGQLIRTQVSATLKNVFMHLFRNALDHGIEAPGERRAAGKEAAGTISLEARREAGMLQLRLRDDGRGLALARIRDKALHSGLISADEVLSDEALVLQIFRPGFSTAATVTDVSGRGVGMDAVQDFLKREQGRIEIRFTDEAIGAPFRQFETLISLPENCAEQLAEGSRRTLIDTAELAAHQAATRQPRALLRAI
ncbi:Hpt domain-containing protein [Uliginosibacterium sediminicola]|uniref:Hpt domain-containing protein n=1 Tax=Uliginosibacterium sediminicola TaxID=2024550 RepID=A0ABU9Z371_9RHOO